MGIERTILAMTHARADTKHRQVTDLDVVDLGFCGPRIESFQLARQVLCGDASRLCLDYFSKHLSSVLRRTELSRGPESWPQKPQIIRKENHHLALFEDSMTP